MQTQCPFPGILWRHDALDTTHESARSSCGKGRCCRKLIPAPCTSASPLESCYRVASWKGLRTYLVFYQVCMTCSSPKAKAAWYCPVQSYLHYLAKGRSCSIREEIPAENPPLQLHLLVISFLHRENIGITVFHAVQLPIWKHCSFLSSFLRFSTELSKSCSNSLRGKSCLYQCQWETCHDSDGIAISSCFGRELCLSECCRPRSKTSSPSREQQNSSPCLISITTRRQQGFFLVILTMIDVLWKLNIASAKLSLE